MTDAVRAALEKAERAIDTFMDEEKRADILFRQRTADIAVDALVDIQKARAALANDGWRDMESAPRDKEFIGRRRDGGVVKAWWQEEFNAFISGCRQMVLAPGYQFKDGSTQNLHSPELEDLTGWIPKPPEPKEPSHD